MAGSSWPTFTQNTRAKASEIDARFEWLEQDIVPMNNGTRFDDTYDLGTSLHRWRDIRFSRYIISPPGSETNPSFANVNEMGTGIFFPSTTEMAVSTDGEESFRGAPNQFLAQTGTSTIPSISFNRSRNMGFYQIAENNLGGAINSQKWLDVDTQGAVSFPLQPLFRAYLNTTLSFNTPTSKTLSAGMTVEYDVGNGWTSGVYTIPKSGVYVLFMGAHWGNIDASGSTYWNGIEINGFDNTLQDQRTILNFEASPQLRFTTNFYSYFTQGATISFLAGAKAIRLTVTAYSLVGGTEPYITYCGAYRLPGVG